MLEAIFVDMNIDVGSIFYMKKVHQVRWPVLRGPTTFKGVLLVLDMGPQLPPGSPGLDLGLIWGP